MRERSFRRRPAFRAQLPPLLVERPREEQRVGGVGLVHLLHEPEAGAEGIGHGAILPARRLEVFAIEAEGELLGVIRRG